MAVTVIAVLPDQPYLAVTFDRVVPCLHATPVMCIHRRGALRISAIDLMLVRLAGGNLCLRSFEAPATVADQDAETLPTVDFTTVVSFAACRAPDPFVELPLRIFVARTDGTKLVAIRPVDIWYLRSVKQQNIAVYDETNPRP